jgi:hypothetical protein
VSTFKLHQDVAVVEHDDATRKPREGGEVRRGYIADISGGIMEVRCGEDCGYFDLDTGWPALERCRTMRLVPVCYRTDCENPALDPYTDPGDPLRREWCSDECHDDSGQAWMEQHYRSA